MVCAARFVEVQLCIYKVVDSLEIPRTSDRTWSEFDYVETKSGILDPTKVFPVFTEDGIIFQV